MIMRIAIDYTPAVKQGAGIGRYTRGLVATLAEIDRQNHYVLLVVGNRNGYPDRQDWPPNFSLRRVRFPHRLLTLAWHRLGLPLPAETFTGSVDIFHSPDFVLPPLRGARGIITIHDLAFMRVPECADPGLRAYLSQVVPKSAQRCDHILADSTSTRQDIIELLGVPPERISVVPAGVEPRFLPVSDREELERVRRSYSLDEPFVLSLGTLEPRKNYVHLIEAHAQMRQAMPSAPRLLIAGGRGWLFEDILATAERYGDMNVRLLGYVPDDDLPALYTQATLFAFPSLYEGFGLPPLEAMACGTPVVCSDRSSLPETVGDAALMVDAEDTSALATAMQRLLEDSQLRADMIRKGLAQAGRFTWDKSARKLLAAYREVRP